MAPVAEEVEQRQQHSGDVERFIALLVAAASGPRPRATVVLTVRADFYNPLIRQTLLSTLLPRQQVNILPMGSSDLRSAIETPAKKVGLSFAPPALIDQILNDVGVEEGRLNDSSELAKLTKAATGDWDREVISTDEPFVGLRAMDESWANRFFGRKGEVRELVEKFKKHRLLAIVADSGAGKSSLAQAGLIPAFRGGALADESREEPDDKIWQTRTFRTRHRPGTG